MEEEPSANCCQAPSHGLLVVAEVVGEGGGHVDLPLDPLGAEDGVPGPRLQQQHVFLRVLPREQYFVLE